MYDRLTPTIVAALLSTSISSPVAAHHSYIYTPFDPCQSTSIEGEIQAVTWKEPHVWFTVKTDDSTVYQVEWVGLAGLVNQGIESADLPLGERIVVTGSPHPSANTISLLTEVRVVGGELNWSRAFPNMVRPTQQCAPPQR